MATLLLHAYIFAGIYIGISLLVMLRLLYVVLRGGIKNMVPRWFLTVLLDSLSWPYYVFRYGVEGFYKEIK